MAWDDLRFVLTVAEQGTLSGAARVLGVNHSTVLRRVSSFEDKKGVKVFERTGNGYTLTPESRHLLTSLRAIEDQVNGLDRAMARQGLELDGPVRITTTDSFAVSGLVQHVASFQKEHPGVVVELNVSNSYVNFTKMDADITIRPAPRLPDDMVGERACDLMTHVYATQGYLDQNPATSFSAHKWLGVSEPISSSRVGQWQDENLPAAAIVLKSSSFVALRDVAETGMGMALLPCCLGDPSPHLVRAKKFPDGMKTSIWVATHKDMMGSTKVQSIISWFAEAVRQDTDLFEGRTNG
ncbi:MAG: LysR family transcriptional regulator [Alphaproteobacteria bacterium]|jgi:DNA-binding transcriptional LysR family regulator|nr:LysR family transcriptional regulator [Alphaproteobacteria bacterium]MBT4019631.1 LysR family transcriptional regulator [Alphaproteobacteria bacterium]MBT4967100.1 LysR family transcriptional regulator [Alphaproteobacteria bacterium]MBT5161782.1 LysR family transcriptional regulator [Alphaproteobacteria bacterium]